METCHVFAARLKAVLQVPDFGTLTQCISSGFQNDKIDEGATDDNTEDVIKEASENFENMCKRFLDPKNLYIQVFGTLTQCIWSGFQNEKTDEAAADDDTEEAIKEASEDFKKMCKRFLYPKNLYIHVFGTLTQCIWAGFQNEKKLMKRIPRMIMMEK